MSWSILLLQIIKVWGRNQTGAVLPVGGIKEKILTAHRAGITRVILPKENLRDIEEVPEDVWRELNFVPVGTIEEVLKDALGLDLPLRPVVVPVTDQCAPVHNL